MRRALKNKFFMTVNSLLTKRNKHKLFRLVYLFPQSLLSPRSSCFEVGRPDNGLLLAHRGG